ncbi:DUF3883 domain-containing protein [Brevundimonas subvibrioides]|uniref:DUF3883 domain-containing protein n=1 Tax=Brevundimonas subvibrioides TaxID=74313 RepID=UPI0002F3C569|nr:DUF3883 domain-containing protein [Brevundimonas subvibrioides]
MALIPNERSDWTAEENDLIVADYFAMLGAELSGEDYVKARHARALDQHIGRGHKSIEFKHMNVSAALAELGLPHIRGYRPMANYQRALFPALERYLDAHPNAWTLGQNLPTAAVLGAAQAEQPANPTDGVENAGTHYVGPQVQAPAFSSVVIPTHLPPSATPRRPRPDGLVRLVRKYDPATRDNANRALGRLGEQHILNHEIARLVAADRMDLAKKVEWTADVHGDGAGYDIRSFEPDGSDRLIEVKATRGGPTTDFFLTRTEREVSEERPDAWRLYRLHTLPVTPRLFVLPPPLEASVRLEAENWRAAF